MMPTNGSFLVDTNILVYAYDRSEHGKQRRALEILDWLDLHQAGYLSTQILGEFYSIATHKIRPPLTAQEGAEQVEGFLRSWKTLEVSRLIVLEATRGCVRHQLAYWDAQIWATAKLNQIPAILSEDFSHGRLIEGIEFINPFVADFPEEE